MWNMIGKLWTQTPIATTFWYDILCVLTLVTWKLQVVCRALYMLNDCSAIRDVYFLCSSWRHIRLTSYASKHTSHSLSGKPFVHTLVLRHIIWKPQVISGHSAHRMTAILAETFFVWFRVALEIWLESYVPRYASVFSDATLCVYTCVCKLVHVYTSLFGAQLHLRTKLTYFMTA